MLVRAAPRARPPVPVTHIVVSGAMSLCCLPPEPSLGQTLWSEVFGRCCTFPDMESLPCHQRGSFTLGPVSLSLLERHLARTAREGRRPRGGPGVGWGSDVSGKGPSRALASLWPQQGHSGPEHSGSTGRYPWRRSRLVTRLWSWGLGEEGRQGPAQACDLRRTLSFQKGWVELTRGRPGAPVHSRDAELLERAPSRDRGPPRTPSPPLWASPSPTQRLGGWYAATPERFLNWGPRPTPPHLS